MEGDALHAQREDNQLPAQAHRVSLVLRPACVLAFPSHTLRHHDGGLMDHDAAWAEPLDLHFIGVQARVLRRQQFRAQLSLVAQLQGAELGSHFVQS